MGNLQEKLNSDIKQAMRDKNELKRDTLRLLKGELERSFKESDDATVSKAAKKLIEGIVETDSDKGEVAILEEFILKQLTEQDIKRIAENYSDQLGYVQSSDFGKMMGEFKKNYEGQYDGKVLSGIVKQLLG